MTVTPTFWNDDNGGTGNNYGNSCAQRTTFDDAAATLTELERELDGVEPWMRGLRARLRSSLGDARPARIARELGLSQRSLQRRLQEAGSSFQRDRMRSVSRNSAWKGGDGASAAFRTRPAASAATRAL